jgi:hypothetical protein
MARKACKSGGFIKPSWIVVKIIVKSCVVFFYVLSAFVAVTAMHTFSGCY